MNRLLDRLDNPILVKHLRSRLRLQPLISSLVVVLVLGFCVAWGGYVLDGFANGEAFGALFGLQAVVLAVLGSSQVSGSVGRARETGILDFHRVSPLSPDALTVGFFLGAPVREYVLFAGTLPFALFCVVMGAPDFPGFVQLMVLLVVTAWVFHGLALVSVLSVRNPKQAAQGAVAVLAILLMTLGSLISGVYRAALLVEGSPKLSFFSFRLPWLLVVLIYEVPTLFFLFLAARRKMASERAHAYSKPQAVAALATLTVLLLGGLWDVPPDYDPLVLVVVYVLVAVGLLLVPAVTPSLGEYAKGTRRASKLGRPRVGVWHDLALNRPVLFVLCAVVLAGGSVASAVIPKPRPDGTIPDPSWYSMAIAIGVLVLAYYGLALQYFQLVFSRRGVMFFGLFLFLVWLVPLVAGTIISAAGMQARDELGVFVFALSPVAGIALSAPVGGPNAPPGSLHVRAAALCPALTFACLFHYLLTNARRRADRALRTAPANANTAPALP